MDEIAVVTGAGGGIGRAVSRMIHEKSEGALKLALCDINASALAELTASLPGSFACASDIRTEAGRKALLDAVLAKGTPSVLVNNAGIDKPHEPALNVLEGSFDALLDLNLKAPAFLMRLFGKEMIASGGGAIVNISSVLAKHALTGSAFYRVSKAGLEALTKQFAAEFGPKGVRVNAVAPGFIMTPMTKDIPAETKEKIRSLIALGRFGEPEAVAEGVWHLIENQYVNGAVLPVDGGMVL
ncbi:MAG: SDR family oxidoreductase [Elusimicrobia bacterium]|nr:SDR family oxidoreductase [Elusimicrobiota bacterium]